MKVIGQNSQMFKVTDNGKYVFRIKASNGRSTKITGDVTNAAPLRDDILSGLAVIDTNGNKMIRVRGTTESSITEETVYKEEVYNFNVIRINGDLELSTELGANGKVKINEVETDINEITDFAVSTDGKTYSVGNQADVATASAYAKNGVVLKIEGDLKIGEGTTLTAVASTRWIWRTKRNVYIL